MLPTITLNGSVPAASPRSFDHRRHIQADLMMQVNDSDPFGAELGRRELPKLAEKRAVDGGGVDVRRVVNGDHFHVYEQL